MWTTCFTSHLSMGMRPGEVGRNWRGEGHPFKPRFAARLAKDRCPLAHPHSRAHSTVCLALCVAQSFCDSWAPRTVPGICRPERANKIDHILGQLADSFGLAKHAQLINLPIPLAVSGPPSVVAALARAATLAIAELGILC